MRRGPLVAAALALALLCAAPSGARAEQTVTEFGSTGSTVVTLSWGADHNQYVVTIPTTISYKDMPVGRVSTSDSFDVTATGTWDFDKEVRVTGGSCTLEGGLGTITGASASKDSPLAFKEAGTQRDTITMSGVAMTSGTYTGGVGYTAELVDQQ